MDRRQLLPQLLTNLKRDSRRRRLALRGGDKPVMTRLLTRLAPNRIGGAVSPCTTCRWQPAMRYSLDYTKPAMGWWADNEPHTPCPVSGSYVDYAFKQMSEIRYMDKWGRSDPNHDYWFESAGDSETLDWTHGGYCTAPSVRGSCRPLPW